jgi:hypothetical protein
MNWTCSMVNIDDGSSIVLLAAVGEVRADDCEAVMCNGSSSM